MLRVAEIYECLSSQPRLQSQEWGNPLRGKGLVQVLKKNGLLSFGARAYLLTEVEGGGHGKDLRVC